VTERMDHDMADPRITRDILQGALNKHMDNDDTESFERVINAMNGLEDEIARYLAARRMEAA
jgi:predicted chitinase